MGRNYISRRILNEIWRRGRENEHRDADKSILHETASRTNEIGPILVKNNFVLMHLRFTPRRRKLTAFPEMVMEITSSCGGIWDL